MATVDGEGDQDEDGWGTAEDCDDADASVHPGASEVAYDGVDQDCDGADLEDRDGDGAAGIPAGGDDCADGDPGVHPGAAEVCGDLLDQDCDGEADSGCDTAATVADPGGFAWVCGPPVVAGGSWWLGVLVAIVGRRRGVRCG